MSNRNDVRVAISNWFGGGAITNLNQIFTTFPKKINYQVGGTAGQLSRAAAVVFLENEVERRDGEGGASAGWKRVDYSVVFQVYFHSVEKDETNVMLAFDTLIDAIKARLRAGGHRLGLPNGDVIWQAGEGQVTVNYGEPMLLGTGATEIWAGIRFTVTQYINA